MNGPLAVVIQRRAALEVDAIDDWWRRHRTAAPDLFMSELARMLSAIALMNARAEYAECFFEGRATTSTTASALARRSIRRYPSCSRSRACCGGRRTA